MIKNKICNMKKFKFSDMGLKSKLISIFILIKIIPLILVNTFAVSEISILGKKIDDQYHLVIKNTQKSVKDISVLAEKNSKCSLDDKAREHIEYLTTITAKMVADFLYSIDDDIRLAAVMSPTYNNYKKFISKRKRKITKNEEWCYDAFTDKWKRKNNILFTDILITPINKNNTTDFHYSVPKEYDEINIPLYLEITFIDLKGQEKIKITTSDLLSNKLKDVSKKKNTYCKAEDYFYYTYYLDHDNDIYVSDVIGPYVKSYLIGDYTKENCKKRGIEFNPSESAYAGKENPIGKHFRGLIRWISPVYNKENKKIGYVTLALDHRHLMEFTNHIDPTDKIFTPIPDASKGNYAFMWDNKGRNIAHPREYFICGYDPKTGIQAVPWMDVKTYKIFKKKGVNFNVFSREYPPFYNQSLDKHPAPECLQNGLISLDGRFLNFAPQCSGWYNLTQYGGSGSFVIYWSGIWKLTTSAAIPYYTGLYGQSKRGFGYISIGANIDTFHRDSINTVHEINKLYNKNKKILDNEFKNLQHTLFDSVDQTTFSLVMMTSFMILFVIIIAIWIATKITDRIKYMIVEINKFQHGNFNSRLEVNGNDELSRLSIKLNDMADHLSDTIEELKQAKKNSEEMQRTKGLFLTNMSHEIRTPANGIYGLVNILLKSDLDLPKKEKGYLESLQASSNALRNVVNEILDFSQIREGKINIVKTKTNISEILKNIINIFKYKAEEKDLNLHTTIIKEIPEFVKGDSAKVQQILINLVSNAIKYTQRGAIKITVNLLYETKDMVRLKFCVIDQGFGISPEKQKIIFDAFEQVNNNLNKRHSGNGLGLSICKGLVELMGGEIGINSKLGIGSTFWFTMDFEKYTQSTIEEIEEIEVDKSVFKYKKILIVEDNSTNALVAKSIIERYQMGASVASCGSEALIMLERDTFDLILMDIQMTLLDGYATSLEIRKQEKENNLKRTPIIACTAYATEDYRKRSFDSDMDDFISKPFTETTLINILYKWLK